MKTGSRSKVFIFKDMIYTYNGILFILLKEGNPAVCIHMDEPGGHDAK